MKTQTISIIGLNRVGVSVGLALKKSKLDVTLVGHDPDKAAMQAAKDNLNAIDKLEYNLRQAAAKADILVITLPFSSLEIAFEIIGDVLQEHAVVIDLTSQQKGTTLAWATKHLKSGHYIGAVPLVNADYLADGRSAVAAADADLFRNSVFCIAPSPMVDPQAVNTAVTFGHYLGALPYFVEPDEYEQLAQGTETLPGLLAAALFGALSKSTGWRDMLRLAGLPFGVSTTPLEYSTDAAEIALANKLSTLRWLDAMMYELQQMRRWIADDEKELLTAYMEGQEIERLKWLDQRSANDWVEAKPQEIPRQGFTEQMLGTFLMGRGRKGKDE